MQARCMDAKWDHPQELYFESDIDIVKHDFTEDEEKYSMGMQYQMAMPFSPEASIQSDADSGITHAFVISHADKEIPHIKSEGIADQIPFEEESSAISPLLAGTSRKDPLPCSDLLHCAAEKLQLQLKRNWICFVEGDGVHVMLLSRKHEKSIQRRIFFSSNGQVELSVHCVPVPLSAYLSTWRSVNLFDRTCLDDFVEMMTVVVHAISQFEICTGVCHEKYKHLWPSSSNGQIDQNPYQEIRYSLTFRSIYCKRLIPPRKRVCSSCDRLHDALRLRFKNSSKPGVHRHTANRCLTSQQKDLKLCWQRKELRRLRTILKNHGHCVKDVRARNRSKRMCAADINEVK